jgi:ketopantoate reductase
MLWFKKNKKEEQSKEDILQNHQIIDDEITIAKENIEKNINAIEEIIDIENDIDSEETENLAFVEKEDENVEETTDKIIKEIIEEREEDTPLERDLDNKKVKTPKIEIDEKYLDIFSKPISHNLVCTPCKKPIYILGGGNVGSYIATKLKNYGHKVIIISSHISNKILKTEGVNIYEEFSDNNINAVLNTSLKIEEEPSMLIIATKTNKLKLALTAINPKKLNKCPIIDFSIGNNEQYLRNFFGYSNISKAFLEGCISKNKYGKTQVLSCEPKIFISPANGFAHKEIYNILYSTGLTIRTITDKISAFWNLFTPYFIGSIITTLYNQKINNILENNKRKKITYACVEEIENLAKSEKIEINKQQIINKLHNISGEYTFPLHRDINIGKIGESGIFQEIINEKTEKNKIKCKIIKSIFKQIYGYILV